MLLSDFDYDLPSELIARYPAKERRGSRLLVVRDRFADRRFADLLDLLREGDLLVLNDTRVIPARLRGVKDSGGKVEVLIERVLAEHDAIAQIRASKSPKPGARLLFGDHCEAMVGERERGMFALTFSEPVMTCLGRLGEVPLPPYLERDAESADDERYQTVYAASPGAVAAPTAGLHFDAAMLAGSLARGVRHAFVTLHVGAGTFQPLREPDIAANRLHAERVQVSKAVCEQVQETRAAGGRVIAIGTTSVRALEAAAASGTIEAFDGETDIFIRPGYRFRVVDVLLTNFHLPQSSLLMLVAAFAGRDRILAAYAHAVRERYRFFSYGDAMLLYPDAR